MRIPYQSKLWALAVCGALLFPEQALANQCAMNALQAIKNAGSDQRKLKAACYTHLDEWLASRPVAAKWKNMNQTARSEQHDYMCRVVASLAGDLRSFAEASITWVSDTVGIALLNGKSTRFSVRMGTGCKIKDVCTPSKGCLSSTIGDYRKLSKRK